MNFTLNTLKVSENTTGITYFMWQWLLEKIKKKDILKKMY